ncbi:hypothetical protein DEU56DRAFT_76951 [Suillus clintonianus]|uniref:uncharacterized protein n=1 Tax=Suillus clintonianus TaxID=1904413 RepID=UPI001B8748A0|nr:uncharacterized protein DEU56DRAFT_76951 [Suillus clintonianus]KAG2122218.1 hypothetical protein DEU56DRAFT_76951 [Suillus clintonianus]
MDRYATEMNESSIPGPSQDEPQPQLQHAEPVPFDMYADSSQYAPPGPAPTAHGMATAVFDAGMAQYGQPPLMPDMTGPVAVPPFAAHFPQSQMVPGPLYDHSIPPPFAPYFPQPQMAPGPLYDPSIPPPFQPYFAQPQMTPGPLYDPSIPPPFEPHFAQPQMVPGLLYDPSIPPPFENYFPQSQMMPGPSHHPFAPPPCGMYLPQPSGTSNGYPIPPPQSYDGYAAGPQFMGFMPYYYPSPRKTLRKRQRLDYDAPPNFQRVVKRGKVEYKCLLKQCKKTDSMNKGSMLKHIDSKTHSGRTGQHLCEYCGKDLSRSDSLNRHYKSCSKRPKGPGDSTPGSGESSED